MEDLKTQIENVKNDWLVAKGEIKALEQQLVKERGKIRRLANDKHDLQDKVLFLTCKCAIITRMDVCVCVRLLENENHV